MELQLGVKINFFFKCSNNLSLLLKKNTIKSASDGGFLSFSKSGWQIMVQLDYLTLKT